MDEDASSTATVGVVGLGYVGLPLALALSRTGYDVIGVDIDEDRVETLSTGRSYINDADSKSVATAIEAGFRPRANYDALADVDAVSICVPTPLRKTGRPDTSFVIEATETLAGIIPEGCTVILESTVYPGATKEVVGSSFEEAEYRIGEDVYLAFSPERIDPGNDRYGVTDIPKVVGGVTEACGNHAQAFYERTFQEVVRVKSASVAEFSKLLENTYRGVNIALINEIATVAHELGVDIWEVVGAASTKPFGFEPFYPGPGLGGHCIPVDPMYLSWKAEQHGVDTRMIDLADTINREMPKHVVHRTVDLLNDRRTLVPDSEILVLGVTYKPNVSDTRESPAIDIIDMLTDRGADVGYHDPLVPELDVGERSLVSEELSTALLNDVDCVVLLSAHSSLPLKRVVEEGSLIFDTRNALADYDADNVVPL